MEDVVTNFPDVLCVFCVEIEPINGYIVVKMTSWVKALALDAGQLGVIVLSAGKLPSLVDISSVAWSISSEWHPKTWQAHQQVSDTHDSNHSFFVHKNP